MAINKNDGAPSIDTETTTATAAPTQAAPVQDSNAGRTVGIMEVNALRRAAITRFGMGETVESFKKAFEKQLEGLSADDKKQFQLEVMNRDTDKIFMSTLLIMRPTSFQGGLYTLVYALPIEASNPIEDRRVFQAGGQTNEISWAATDVLDEEFYKQLVRYTKSVAGNNVKVVYAGGRVIPMEMKSDDENHIVRILHEADQALLTAAEQQIMHTSGAVISVAMFNQDGARATVAIDPTPTDRDNSVGLPVRSGINIQLRATKNISLAQQNQSLNQRDQDLTLTRVDAYVDATYDTRYLQQQPAWPGQPVPTQRFIPRIMITAVDSLQNLQTPETTLLAIATATVLTQNPGNWANSLRPRHAATMSADLARMADVGVLPCVVPMNPSDPTDLGRVKTDPRSFGDREFEQLIEASFIKDPMFSLIVEESGERSWLTDMYQFAASGNPAAVEQIVRTADNLTNGAFSRIWTARGGGNIVYNDNNRIHLGYFVDGSGKRVDLLTVDTLAILNLYADKEIQTAYDWIQTYNPATGTIEARLATREMILRDTFNQVTIKGYGRTVTFYREFLEVLMQAIHTAGLEISPANTRLNDFQTKPQFGIYDPNLFALSAQQTGGAFTYGQLGNPANYRGIGGMMSGMFGR